METAGRPELEKSSLPEVSKVPSALEKLKPREVIDADGARRQFFTFTTKRGLPVQVAFYTREELPYSEEALKGRSTVILGEAPKHRDISEWNQFTHDVKNLNRDTGTLDPLQPINFQLQEAMEKGRLTFLVENTPVHMLDLASYLGAGSSQLREARKKAAIDNVYSPEIYQLLDDAIAGTIVDDEGHIRQREKQEGEALAVLALLGDEEAKEALEVKKDVIAKLDSKRDQKNAEEDQAKIPALATKVKYPPTTFELTHVTSFLPEVTPEGVIIKTNFDATRGAETRSTVHFSLLGPISMAFGGGDWEKRSILVTGDLAQTKNRNPNTLRNINPIDTYFAMNPGQPLLIPNGHIIRPGHLPLGTYRETKGAVTLYKNKDLQPADIDSFFMDQLDKLPEWERTDIYKKFGVYLDDNLWQENIEAIKTKTKAEFVTETVEFKQASAQRKAIKEKLGAQKIFSRLRSAGIDETAEELNQELVGLGRPDITGKLKKILEAWLVTKIRDGDLVNATESWHGGEMSTKERALFLAAEWGVRGTVHKEAHQGDPNGGSNVEQKILKFFHNQEIDKANFHQRGLSLPRKEAAGEFRNLRVDLNQFREFLLPQFRRTLYITGIL